MKAIKQLFLRCKRYVCMYVWCKYILRLHQDPQKKYIGLKE